MAHAVIFGAGRVGRGLLGEVFQQAGFTITFVDKNINLVDAINRDGHYDIRKINGPVIESMTIRQVSALHATAEGTIVELLCTPGAMAAVAISPFSLQETANVLAMAIARRARVMPDEPFDILLCDNSAAGPSGRLHDMMHSLLGGAALEYLDTRVGIVRTVVMRLFSDVPASSTMGALSLSLLSNGYPELPVDAEGFKGPPLDAPMIRLCKEFTAESIRKTYTLNMAQAAMAYLGTPLGLQFASQAIEHPGVRPYIQQALEEATHGLCAEYGFTPEEMTVWNEQIFTMLQNPSLGDPLYRLGIDAGRKVGLHERLVGAAQLCQRHDRAPAALARAIAYAYLYKSDDPGTRRLQNAVEQEGVELAMERFSQLDYRSRLRALVLEEYERAAENAKGDQV